MEVTINTYKSFDTGKFYAIAKMGDSIVHITRDYNHKKAAFLACKSFIFKHYAIIVNQ